MCEEKEIAGLVKELACRLQTLPTQEPTCYPSFLDEKRPRFLPDPDKVPLITHASVYEIRPTNEMKAMKKGSSSPDVVYVRINSVHNPHASPPWYHPCDPRFQKEKARREIKEDIWPTPTINLCQMPAVDMTKIGKQNKELDCVCSEKSKDIKLCQWKEQPYMTAEEKDEKFLCSAVK